MNQQGHQSIGCSVDTCKHYVQGGGCSLKNIQVAPLTNMVNSAEESMCQSFERKDE